MEWERHWFRGDTTRYVKLLAEDYEKQKEDPLLYAGKLTQQEAEKLPGVVLMTGEFQICRRDAHKLLPKLK